MTNSILRVLLTLVLSCLCNGVNGKANFKDVEEELKQLNKPAVKTTQVKVFTKTEIISNVLILSIEMAMVE